MITGPLPLRVVVALDNVRVTVVLKAVGESCRVTCVGSSVLAFAGSLKVNVKVPVFMSKSKLCSIKTASVMWNK